ncbi:MAG: alpha/beta hydrolase [Kutzneria sp.]|nr:alpha/beta hydrolase [Kutzneria sp.]
MPRRTALTVKQALTELSRPGPAGVQRGDLAATGLPGMLFTPRSGRGCPVVVFGHGWLQPPARYVGLFRHLASWGFVVAAPATQRGPFASSTSFATDLRTALDVCSGARLGDGGLTVDPAAMALGGHATGGGCAVLAAAEDTRVRAVFTLAAAETSPSALSAASACTMPALHLAAGEDLVAPPVGHCEAIARAWAGPVQLRTVTAASHLGFTEGWHWSQLLVHGKAESRTQVITKAVITAFLLRVLTKERRYVSLLDGDLRRAAISYQRGSRPVRA